MAGFFHFGGGSEIRTRDGVNHTCFPGKLLVYPDSLLPVINEPLVGLFHQLAPSAFKKPKGNERAGPLDLLRVQGLKMVRASGNAPDPGTHLVRCGL
jgi:hypothetical protein